MKNIKLKSTKGITLIALVVTIIVLLILAGVSIAALTGDNGILTIAEEAKNKTTEAEEEEKVKLAIMGSWGTEGSLDLDTLKENLKKEGITYNTEATTFPLIVEENGISKKITDNGSIYVNIAAYVKVGQYVDYEPTKTDLNKTQAVDENKLTYTSPTGTIPTDSTGTITHGNGYTSLEEATEDKPAGGQTFTAKVNDGSNTGLKWRVLSVSEDKVELISDTLVKTDAGADFILQGGIGYLYAEQELNEACKIYGYGYGADTSIETTYTVGGPEDIPVIGTIKGSGARSITIDDLNKIAGIYEDATDGQMKYSDGTVINSSYGTISLITTVSYPTLSSSNTNNPGQSTSNKSGFKYTYYSWNKSKITDTNIQNVLFNGNYWLASRCIVPANSWLANFKVRQVINNDIDGANLCDGYNGQLYRCNAQQLSSSPCCNSKA